MNFTIPLPTLPMKESAAHITGEMNMASRNNIILNETVSVPFNETNATTLNLTQQSKISNFTELLLKPSQQGSSKFTEQSHSLLPTLSLNPSLALSLSPSPTLNFSLVTSTTEAPFFETSGSSNNSSTFPLTKSSSGSNTFPQASESSNSSIFFSASQPSNSNKLFANHKKVTVTNAKLT